MKTSIGIDIGTEHIKVVSLFSEKDSVKLAGIGKINFKDGKGKLAAFLKQSGLSTKDIRINIEDPSMKVRRLDLPEMTAEELPEAVRWGMKNIVDGDVESYEFRFLEISPEDVQPAGKKPYLVFALKRAAVERQIEVYKELGLPGFPSVMEPDVSALQSLFTFTKGSADQDYSVLIDFGSALSQFIVIGKGGMLFSRPLIGCADSNFVDQIQRDLGVDMAKAEEIKSAYRRSVDLGFTEETMKVFMNTEAHFASRVALEVQRSIDGFTMVFDKKKVSKIYLCGGGATWPGRVEHLKTTLGVECAIFDPFEKIDTQTIDSEAFRTSKALYAAAVGLAVD